MVTATVNPGLLVEDILQLPYSIQHQNITSADYEERAMEYYLQYSPQATWAELAGELYCRECGEAVAAARRFIKRTPGKCECTCIYLVPAQI